MQVQRSKKSIIIFIVIALLVVIALGVAGYFAKQYYDLRSYPSMAANQEATQLTTAVNKLYELPKDEKPVIGSVQDKEKLKDQPFFKNAQNGDKILIYQKAKMAIIYRQQDNKLINVGPITIDTSPQQNSGTSSTAPTNNAGVNTKR